MLSSLWQTVIGAAAALVGGLGAAFWQTMRADNVAQRIRRAERRERGLLDLNAEVTKTNARFSEVRNNVRSGVLRGLAAQQVPTNEYESAQQPLRELYHYWEGLSSGLIPDQDIMDAFTKLHRVMSTRLWYDGTRAYSGPPPISGKIDTTQFLQDTEAVYLALSDLQKRIRHQVQALRLSESRRHMLLAAVRTRKGRIATLDSR